MEARDEKRLLKLQRELQAVKLLIVDELGYVPLTPTGAELRIPKLTGRAFRFEAGRHSGMKPATIPINIRPL